jgi:hypothetical protein
VIGPTPVGDKMETAETIELYDPERGEWSTVCDGLPFSMRRARMLAFRGRLLVLSLSDESPTILRLALVHIPASHPAAAGPAGAPTAASADGSAGG